MGFDGKSIINPRQINIVHDIYTPKQKDIIFAEKVVREIDEKKAQGIGVFTVDGKMIDIAFIGTPTCDEYGNCRGIGGKSDCGVLSYAMADAQYADHVVAITDCMVPFPNFPAHISMTNVDYVVAVDEIGDPNKIATGAAKPTDMRKLMMADYCTQFVINTPYFKDGFSYQTGVGGASIASTISCKSHERTWRAHEIWCGRSYQTDVSVIDRRPGRCTS